MISTIGTTAQIMDGLELINKRAGVGILENVITYILSDEWLIDSHYEYTSEQRIDSGNRAIEILCLLRRELEK